MAVLYQVVEQGRQSALVCENTDGIRDLHALLAQAAANMKHTGGGFAEALNRAGTELGVPFRQVLADEADALSHDLGHGGAAEQRILIDLDSGRIRVEYDHRADSLRESLETLADHFPTTATKIQNRLIAFLAEHDGSEELYEVLHNELGLNNQEIEAMGFDLPHRYEPDCSDAYQDIVDYIRFEQETSKIWPWFISGDEMFAHETNLREIAGQLAAAGEWDTESIYDGLTEAFGPNPLLTEEQEFCNMQREERGMEITKEQLELLGQLEEFRKKHEHQAEPSDWAIRMCEAFVARSIGFTDRMQWTDLLRQRGETLFTFDWKSGSVSDHVVQWCKENHRNWRYSHLGELQVSHGGEWRKVDYFCRDGSETRVYFPPEPVREQQLQALAEDPVVHLRDLLTLGLPDHDVYLVHAAEDVGWVPAADLSRLTAQGKEEFSELLNARVAAIRPGPYGVKLVLDGVNSQLLAQYDETLANSSRAEHAMELFL